MMEKWESESSKILSFQQLHAASRQIPSEYITKVARQLGLDNKDLGEIDFHREQRKPPGLVEDKMLLILEAWKDKYPAECTLEKLTNALILLKLDLYARNVEAAINELKSTNGILYKDEKCSNKLRINEKLVTAVFEIVSSKIYRSLGFTLGLERHQIDDVELKCQPTNTAREYVRETLMKWIEQDPDANLGKLYRAIRMFDLKHTADQVFEKCIALTENPGNARSENPDLK